MSCVAQVTEALAVAGAITEEEKDALVSAAARSDCGVEGFVRHSLGVLINR